MVGYASGLSLLQLIPQCGAMVAPIWTLVVLIPIAWLYLLLRAAGSVPGPGMWVPGPGMFTAPARPARAAGRGHLAAHRLGHRRRGRRTSAVRAARCTANPAELVPARHRLQPATAEAGLRTREKRGHRDSRQLRHRRRDRGGRAASFGSVGGRWLRIATVLDALSHRHLTREETTATFTHLMGGGFSDIEIAALVSDCD